MARPKNSMEVFKLLEKSNCRDCGEKTCLAFAGAVYRGQRQVSECPRLDRETVRQFLAEGDELEKAAEIGRDDYLRELREDIAGVDLADAARRTGARWENGRLTLKVMGKDFSVDREGNLSADIHINPWVAVPLLTYVLRGSGLPPSGDWVSFRELKEGRERYPLFQKRCEEPMRKVADTYTELFDDLVHLFSGKKVAPEFESDISVVLHPLPRVPIMICYWLPEDGIASSLNLFFDRTADENLDIGATFSLGAGLAQMFARIALRHGFR